MIHVVAICGMMGSGKSTMLKRLREHICDCVVLQEDEYNPAPLQSVAEVQDWWDRGAKVEDFDLSALASAIQTLTASADTTTANRVVLLETQFGRQHPALRPLIDLQIWIDVDPDIAFARKVAQISRQMLENPEANSSSDSLAWIAGFCDAYMLTTRKLFANQRKHVGQQSDERLDGTAGPQDVCEQLRSILSPLTNQALSNSNDEKHANNSAVSRVALR